MSRPASTIQTAPVNYAQAASKARSGTSTPSAAPSPITPAGPFKSTINGTATTSGATTPAGSDRGDGVTIPKQPTGIAQSAAINFGTLNDASAQMSSSPAAPSTFASHVKPGSAMNFGSIPSTTTATDTMGVSAPVTTAANGTTAAKVAPKAKMDFNSFFQGGGAAVSAPTTAPASTVASSVASPAVSAAPSSNGSAAPMLPAEQSRRQSTYEPSTSSAQSSPRPPPAILSPPSFPGAPSTPSYQQQANRSFTPAAQQQYPVFSGPGQFSKPGNSPYAMSNGSARQPQAYSPSPAGQRPGVQRYSSSQAPTSPRLPNAQLPQGQYAQYGGYQPGQWVRSSPLVARPGDSSQAQSGFPGGYGYGAYPGGLYPSAPSPYNALQQQTAQVQQHQQAYQQHQGQHQAPSTPSINGTPTPSTLRASTVSPTPSSVSSIPTSSTPAPPPPASNTSHAIPIRMNPAINPSANAFNPTNPTFVPAKRESKAIQIRKPPAPSAGGTTPSKTAAVSIKAPEAKPAPPPSVEKPAVEAKTISEPSDEVKAEADRKAKAEAAEIEAEKKAKADREAAVAAEQAEKERAAKQAAEAAEAAKAEAERRAAEEAAAEAERVEKQRLSDVEAKAEVERKAKADAEERERVAAAEAKAKEEAAAAAQVAEKAAAAPEQKAPALVDASAPAAEFETMPAIAEAIDGDASQPPSTLPSRAASPSGTEGRPSLDIVTPRDGPPALSTARPLTDITNVSYPDGTLRPSTKLNITASQGKFRYDRDFLLQFMNVCRRAPEGMPPPETLGMLDTEIGYSATTPRSGGGFNSGSRGRGLPPAMGSRQPPMGLGSGRPGMGTMGAGGVAKSSTDRFAASSMGGFVGGALGGRQGPMGRVPSSAQPTSRQSSRRGTVRDPRGEGPGGRSAAPATQYAPNGQPIAPLVATENAWAKNFADKKANERADPNSPETVQRKVKALLNKLTMDKFESISDQILEWAQKSREETDGRILRQVIQLVFEKATDEAAWSAMYAKLCRKLQDLISPEIRDESLLDAHQQPVAGSTLFRKYLLNRCQEDFEKGWAQKESAAVAAASKAEEDKAKQSANEQAKAAAAESGKEESKEAEILSDEYYAAQKAKRQGLGLVKFIGELYKLSMLTPRIMHECVVKLLSGSPPEEEDLESLARLLTTVGPMLDDAGAKSQNAMTIYFNRLGNLQKDNSVSSRIRFMLQDLIELKAAKWHGRTEPSGPKTIQEIHQDAARQQREEAQRVASGGRLPKMNEQMARGGSRGGRDRAPAGPDGWSTVAQAAPARPSRAGDMSRFGNVRQPSGPTTGATFGPSGVFSRNKAQADPNAAPETPSARQNAFAALEEANEGDAEPPTPTSAVRPKLNLAPRTKPLESDSTPNEQAAAEDEEEAPAVDTAAIKRSVDNSVKEFFELKDYTEAVTACKALPDFGKRDFVQGLASKVIDAREEKVDLLCQLFEQFIGEEAMSGSEVGEGLKPILTELDDLAADAPKAFYFAAKLLRTTSLSEEDVVTLAVDMQSIEGDEEDDRQEVRDRLLGEWRKQSA